MDVVLGVSDKRGEIGAFYGEVGYGGQLGDRETVIVARHEGRIVGAVRISREDGFEVLRGMQVAPAVQGAGIGSLLLDAAVAHLGPRPCWSLPHAHLEAFYARAGFRTRDHVRDDIPLFLRTRRTRYLSMGHDVLIMHRAPRGVPRTGTGIRHGPLRR